MSVKWNANMQFPTDSNFVNRITGAEFGPSNSSGNPMITLHTEVVSPQEVEIDGKMVNIAGVKSIQYYVTDVKDDPEKTRSCRDRITNNDEGPNKGLWPKLGLDPATINWDNIDVKPLLGKLILTQMSPDIEPQRKNPTMAQIEAAKKLNKRAEGDPQTNPLTGAPLINYWPKIRQIFGLAPNQGDVNVPY